LSSAGARLSQAAFLAFGAQRLAIAALLLLEEVEADVDDLTFLANANVKTVDLRTLLEDLGTFTDNLLGLADAYGHAEVRRRASAL
jgi:hypothetical protein